MIFRFLIENGHHAFLTFIRHPRFTLVSCLLLGVGIGLNTTVFSVVNAVLLRPLPFKDADRLILAGAKRAESDVSYPISPAEFWDWKQHTGVFEDMAAFAPAHPALMLAREPMMVQPTVATASLLQMLGVQPQLGRMFTADEEARGDKAVLLTHELWTRAFASDPAVAGKSVRLDGTSYTIVGVLPANFRFFTKTDLWMLVTLPHQMRERRAVGVIAKLRSGIPLERARSELDGVAGQLELSYPNTNRGFTGTVMTPLRNRFVYKVKQSLNILWAAVAIVLLIACGNVGSLQVARSEARHKEVAVRMSMGASRLQVIGQLLLESVLISFTGGVLGLLLSIWAIRLVKHSPIDLPRSDGIHLDPASLLFCFGASGIAALLCAIIPATKAWRVDLVSVLKQSGHSITPGWGLRSMLGGLVVAQTALTLVLVFTAALLVQSFKNMQRIDPGFQTGNLATVNVKLPRDVYAAPFSHTAALKRLTVHLESIPGVSSVGATNGLPIVGQAHNVSFAIRDVPTPPTITVQYRFVTPGYFRTMGIPAKRGRVFTDRDNQLSPRVCMINAAMARHYWPNSDPLGSAVQLPDRLIPGAPWMQVVGVVADVRQLALTAVAAPEVYIPIMQFPNTSEMTFVIRTHGRLASIAAEVRNAIREADKNLPVSNIEWMDDILSHTMATSRFSARVLTVFALFALFMAVTGMYAIISFTVSHRARDMGIRLALGATPGDLVRFVLRLGATFGCIGIATGILFALAIARLMGKLLYEVSPINVSILFSVVTIVLAGVLLACYFPARRVAAMNPMSALRYE